MITYRATVPPEDDQILSVDARTGVGDPVRQRVGEILPKNVGDKK